MSSWMVSYEYRCCYGNGAKDPYTTKTIQVIRTDPASWVILQKGLNDAEEMDGDATTRLSDEIVCIYWAQPVDTKIANWWEKNA